LGQNVNVTFIKYSIHIYCLIFLDKSLRKILNNFQFNCLADVDLVQ